MDTAAQPLYHLPAGEVDDGDSYRLEVGLLADAGRGDPIIDFEPFSNLTPVHYKQNAIRDGERNNGRVGLEFALKLLSAVAYSLLPVVWRDHNVTIRAGARGFGSP